MTDDLKTSVSMMAKIGACWSPSFSPDGSRIAFISDLTGLPQVWTISSKGGWPQRVTALDDQINQVSWSPDGEWLAFNLAPGGGMNQQVYLIRPDGSDLCRLTDGGSETNWLGVWAEGGKKLVISSNRRVPEAMDAYLVDVGTGEFQLAARNQGIGTLTDVSADGKRGVAYRMVNRSDSNLYLVDFVSRSEFLLTPHDGPGNFTLALFAPDGQTVYLTSDQNLENIVFARATVQPNGQPGALEVVAARDDAQLEDFTLTKDGKTAALVWNVAGRSELAFANLTNGEVSAGISLPAEVIFELCFSADGSQLAFVATGAASPRNIWIYDRASGQMTQITDSPHPGVDLSQLVQPELVRFSAHDNLDLSGWLYRPRQSSAPYPIVLSFHGGPEGQERPWFNSTYQALLSQGIAVFAPNVRGSGGFGKTFVNLDNGVLRVNAIRDIKACVDYVVGAGIAKSDKIGIMGGSYGGYMTMAGLTEYPDLFQAGANIFGVVNFKTFFAQTEPWMAAISKIEYGDPDTEGDMLDSLSPIFKIDRVTAPTIVLHGANDTNVPVVEAEQVVDNLKRRGVPVEYVLFPDEGHGFQKEPNRIHAAVSIVQWFVQSLQKNA